MTSGAVGGRLAYGMRPAGPARAGNSHAAYVVVESRRGVPFKPYVYRGSRPVSGPGMCACGCGEMAPVSTRTDRRYGAIKGQPRRYVYGHKAPIRARKVA